MDGGLVFNMPPSLDLNEMKVDSTALAGGVRGGRSLTLSAAAAEVADEEKSRNESSEKITL